MSAPLEAFAAEVRRADADLDLGRAALLIAAGEYPDLSMETCMALLDEIAAGAILPVDASPREIAHALRRRLYHDLDFHGNEAEYYDPRNSYLNEVLVRRIGIPISLAVVYLEVARRMGLEARGVSYPGHFLVKYEAGDGDWIVDPFRRGEEFPIAHFRASLLNRGTVSEQTVDYHLAAVTRRQILTRMLTNLKLIYTEQEDEQRALRIQEYLLAVNPWSFSEIRDRGLLRGRTGDRAGALADLETYLAHAPGAEDAPQMRALVERLRERE